MSADLTQPERVAIARLQALLELLPAALDKELSPAGVTAFEFSLLDALAEAPDQRLRLSALAAKTNATLPRLSRVMNSLERKGFATRMPCEADGRATNAVLTAAGATLLQRARPLHTAAVRNLVLGRLDADGVQDLADLSLRILAALDPDARLEVTSDGIVCAADPTD
ncbi:MarR family winged helix-turn-helix transcriptional regulator [Microbacterium gorillae]|uniref:MarR family winged helix-turn-helix transcriptional regulator n=1 Tax=Microbacterium gorillae TaxID=1231063 RepID=UPI0006946B9C|nr:MarR family transcriptional regulator [Microbacterium gorillae]